MSNTKDELHEICLDIAREIEAVARGEMQYHDGGFEPMPDDGEDCEAATVWDWVAHKGLGDTRFEIDGRGELCTAKTLVAFGGPNIWVSDKIVIGYWGTDRVEIPLDEDARSALWDMFATMYQELG